MKCSNCGDEIVEDAPAIVVSAGWCMPSEVYYGLPERPPECSDCKSRMFMAMTIGIDPGRHGGNLKVSRGGIKYGSDT